MPKPQMQPQEKHRIYLDRNLTVILLVLILVIVLVIVGSSHHNNKHTKKVSTPAVLIR
jgi:hypothetical protein